MSPDMVSDVMVAHPGIASALVLTLGLALAFLGRWSAHRAVATFDRVATDELQSGSSVIARYTPPFVFWAVFVLSAVAALRVLGIEQLSTWLDGVLGFVPRLFAGLVIIGLGHAIGIVVRDLVRRVNVVREMSLLEPRWAYAAVLGVAVITGVQQMGVNIAFVAQLSLIAFTILAGAIGVAFALGARQHVANLVGRAELKRYTVGERVRIDGVEGNVVEIGRTGLVLAAEDGLVNVPASRFCASPATRMVTSGD
jgi:hypothetical protein